MKTNRSLIAMAACAALALPALNSSAQEFVEYTTSPQSFTIALTLKTTVPGTFEIDPETGAKAIDPETGKPIPAYDSYSTAYDKDGNPTKETSTRASKVVTQKYGNAELLREMAANGLLDPNSTSPSGWTLLAFTDGVSPDALNWYTIYAFKRGFEPVFLEITPSASEMARAENSTSINTYKYTLEGDSTITATGSGSYTSEGTVTVRLGPEDSADTLLGTYSESASEFRWYPDALDKSTQNTLYISKGAKITGLAGQITRDEGPSFAVGTATIGAAKAVKVVQPAY